MTKPFRYDDAATDMLALLDRLGISQFKGLGISGGGNMLLHLVSQTCSSRVLDSPLLSALLAKSDEGSRSS